ncbi:hypothetical protein D3C71_2203490 [compost metagenome]
MPVDKGFGVAINDDEYLIRFIALTDQHFATGHALKAIGVSKLGLFQARDGVGQQGRLTGHVLKEQL